MKKVINTVISKGFRYTITATRCLDGSTVASYLYATPNTVEIQSCPWLRCTEKESVFSALESLHHAVLDRIFQLDRTGERFFWKVPFLRRMAARILKDCEKYDPKQMAIFND